MSKKVEATTRGLLLMLALVSCAVGGLALSSAPASGMTFNSTVNTLVSGVNQTDLALTLYEFTGVLPSSVGGQPYTFFTRNATSGASITNAEQYVYEHLLSYGLSSVSYQPYTGKTPGRNVVGEITGATRPSEIVVIGCHLDDMPLGSVAPGADDDASGVAAVLAMAKAFTPYHCERTIRFVFFGGEEIGYLGSAYYAAQAKASGQNIVAMIEADMLAWNATGSQVVETDTRKPTSSTQGDQWIANQYADARATYGIAGIIPTTLAIGINVSDHKSFWANGYPAMLLIEDEYRTTNPNYHTVNDTVSTLTMPFYVAVTKAFFAEAAHIAYLDGTLPSSDVCVYDIAMSGFKSGGSYGVKATVTVDDAGWLPALGATVTGSFSGATSSTASGVTDASGNVTLTSTTKSGGGTWTFTVTGISKAGWSYNTALNRKTSATLKYP